MEVDNIYVVVDLGGSVVIGMYGNFIGVLVC